MGRTDVRWHAWLDLTAELVKRPASGTMPHREIQTLLAEQFDCRTTWTCVMPDGRLVFDILQGPPASAGADELEWWRTDGAASHALIQWYARTGSTRPMTYGRVPRDFVPRDGHARVLESLRAAELDQQLSIPCLTSKAGMWAFALGQPRVDFADEVLAFAGRLQPLLEVVARHVLGGGDPCPEADGFDLTGRELAVLRLLSQGLTAAAIARRLGTAPATVRKHLENVYRKLEVHDRLMAYRVAEQHGLLGPVPANGHERPPTPSA